MLRQILSTIRLRVLALLHRKRLDQDLEDELAFHLAMREEEQRASGVDPETARFAARKRFGNVVALKEACRELWTFRPLEQLAQDVRYALRMLRRDPGFTIVAVLTLALGIGAVAAVLSFLDAGLLRPLPVPHPEKLVVPHWIVASPTADAIEWVSGCDDPGDCTLPFPAFERLAREARSFSGFAAFSNPKEVQVGFRGRTTLADAQFVSGNFLAVLGVEVTQGRSLLPSDDAGAGEAVVVLGHAYWRQRFGGDPAIVGHSIVIDGSPFSVVGIAPAAFAGIDPAKAPAMWVPLHAAARLVAAAKSFGFFLRDRALVLGTIGRMRPGVSVPDARSELTRLFRRAIQDGVASVFDASKGVDVVLVSAERGMTGVQTGYDRTLHLLGGLAGLALAIACANIACLLLARAVARRREISVRLAIGAGRGRLVTQLLTEGLVLSTLGAAAGLALGFWGSRVLALSLNPGLSKDVLTWAHPSTAVLGMTAAVALITTLVFALAPAWAAWQVEPAMDLQPARGVGKGTRLDGKRATRATGWIVAAEVAGTFVLLVGAGLFVRTVIHFVTFDPGFRVDHMLTVGISPVVGEVDSPAVSAEAAALYARLHGIAGVEAVTWTSSPILGEGITFRPLGGPSTSANPPVAASFSVGPRFFHVVGIPVLAGRDVEPGECRLGSATAWVSRSLAEAEFPGVDAVGKSIRIIGDADRVIAGVVADTSLEHTRLARKPTVYVPGLSEARYFLLRTKGSPLSLATQVEGAAAAVAPRLLIRSMKDEAQKLAAEAEDQRLLAASSLVLGGLALLLAAVGLYGVLSYSVSRRTGEIAIRMSLGAVRADILRLVLGEGSRVVLLGAVFGAVGAYWTSRSFSHFLFGVRPVDPLSYGVATLVLLAVAALASYVPASRASRIDPATALRAE